MNNDFFCKRCYGFMKKIAIASIGSKQIKIMLLETKI
jgi:hypothetical protein